MPAPKLGGANDTPYGWLGESDDLIYPIYGCTITYRDGRRVSIDFNPPLMPEDCVLPCEPLCQ